MGSSPISPIKCHLVGGPADGKILVGDYDRVIVLPARRSRPTAGYTPDTEFPQPRYWTLIYLIRDTLEYTKATRRYDFDGYQSA